MHRNTPPENLESATVSAGGAATVEERIRRKAHDSEVSNGERFACELCGDPTYGDALCADCGDDAEVLDAADAANAFNADK